MTYQNIQSEALSGLESITVLEEQLKNAGTFEVKNKALALLRQQKRQFALMLKATNELDQRLTKMEKRNV